MDIEAMLKTVYKKNVFSKAEKKQITEHIQQFMTLLKDLLKKHKVNAEVFMGGSSAKGTFLAGAFDCDIFIRFDYDEYAPFQDQLSDILEPVIEEATKKKAIRVHGSRDYFQYKPQRISFQMTFEMIPVLHVDDPKKSLNVTDVSPHHVLWIKKHLAKRPKLTEDIILAKLFLKSAGLYGAESYIRGFSGHVVDILMVHYGSFMEFIKHAISWEEGILIDVESHYATEQSAKKALNESKIGPLILIDPVQPDRNAAASLSLEKMLLCKERAIAFLADPKPAFFKKKTFSLSGLKRRSLQGTKKYIFHAKALDGKTDVVGSKLLKVYEYLKKRCEMHDFEIAESDWQWDKQHDAYFWFFITQKSISDIKKNPYILHHGPPMHKTEDVAKFKDKHASTFISGKRICTKRKREYLDPAALFSALIDKTYIRERVKKIQKLSL